MIRSARTEDLQQLRDVERAAGELFRAIGMSAVADDEPPSVEALRDVQRGGLLRVFTDERDRPVAYAMAKAVGRCVLVEQVSVHPAHARRGIGRRLLDEIGAWGDRSGREALVLTTYDDVPWNGPYYRRLGFRAWEDGELPEWLRAVRADEIARGLDRHGRRIAMSRPLGAHDR